MDKGHQFFSDPTFFLSNINLTSMLKKVSHKLCNILTLSMQRFVSTFWVNALSRAQYTGLVVIKNHQLLCFLCTWLFKK